MCRCAPLRVLYVPVCRELQRASQGRQTAVRKTQTHFSKNRLTTAISKSCILRRQSRYPNLLLLTNQAAAADDDESLMMMMMINSTTPQKQYGSGRANEVIQKTCLEFETVVWAAIPIRPAE